MTEPLTPETIATLAAGYVVGDLDHAEIEAFEQLLATNPALVAEVAELQTTLAQVVHGLNSVAPPPHLQAAILDAATTKLQPSRRKLSQIPWRTVVGSVAALLILGLGVDNYRLRQDARLNQEVNALLQQSQTQLFALKPVNTSETAGGSFVVNLEQRRGARCAKPGRATRRQGLSTVGDRRWRNYPLWHSEQECSRQGAQQILDACRLL